MFGGRDESRSTLEIALTLTLSRVAGEGIRLQQLLSALMSGVQRPSAFVRPEEKVKLGQAIGLVTGNAVAC